MQKINLLITLTILLIIVFVFVFQAKGNPGYSACFKDNYEFYKKEFMSNDGRIIDYSRNDITTSEGQAYIMMESLIVGDQDTFNLTYNWAKNNLQRKDKLFAWLWGKNKNGQYTILDDNTASDADIDIAFALIMASEKWDKDRYLLEAKAIINSIWDNETRRVGQQLVLSPGVKQNTDEKIEINPSYFSPFAFRVFQKYDELHDWNCLINSSYYYLNEVMSKTKTNLPPNWFLIKNGQVVLEASERSDFSYDATRVFIRIYLDYIETKEKRAIPILEKVKFFIPKWEEDSPNFYTNYKANGELRDRVQYIGTISIITPVIEMFNPDIAKEIYQEKLDSNFVNKKYWDTKDDYYGKNLSLFGYYLFNMYSNECKKSQ